MTESDGATWANTTHDWATSMDRAHLDTVRNNPETFAQDGLLHLVLEVMAYANDEAEALKRRGKCLVTIQRDGSISVADDGRGTETRRDRNGNMIKKSVMATKDLRFFDTQHEVMLPDGRPRRGMSVVAALSRWLVHTNRRENGAWQQRYEHGMPTTDLMPIEFSPQTGTTVEFLIDHNLIAASRVTPADIASVADFPSLTVEVRSV